MVKKVLPYFVAIGASGAEGLNDIKSLLHALPQPTPAVVLVVLHRPNDRVSALREILASSCDMPVVVATDAGEFVPGTCYIGEPNGHLTLMVRSLARLVPGGSGNLRNRTVDMLFHSVARFAGPRMIGVILSGSLDDGSRGLAAIHAAHGLTMVLDPGHKPRGMQQNAIDHDGPISFTGTARQIAERIGWVLAEDRRSAPSQ